MLTSAVANNQKKNYLLPIFDSFKAILNVFFTIKKTFSGTALDFRIFSNSALEYDLRLLLSSTCKTLSEKIEQVSEHEMWVKQGKMTTVENKRK